MANTLSPEYLAGFLDGEGCFRITTGPAIELTCAYPHIVSDLKERYGGWTTAAAPRGLSKKTSFRWAANGPRALRVVNEILPYLREKRPQAKLLLKVSRFPPKTAMRAATLRELRELKLVSYGPSCLTSLHDQGTNRGDRVSGGRNPDLC